MANKPGLLSGKGGWHRDIDGGKSKSKTSSVGMKAKAKAISKGTGGKANWNSMKDGTTAPSRNGKGQK